MLRCYTAFLAKFAEITVPHCLTQKPAMKLPKGEQESPEGMHKAMREKEENSSLAPFQKMKDFSSCLLQVFGRLRSGPGKDEAAPFPRGTILSEHPLVLINTLNSRGLS